MSDSELILMELRALRAQVQVLTNKSDQQDNLMQDAMGSIMTMIPVNMLTPELIVIINKVRATYDLPPMDLPPPISQSPATQGPGAIGGWFINDGDQTYGPDLGDSEPEMDPDETLEITPTPRITLLKVLNRYAIIQTLVDYFVIPGLRLNPEEPEVSLADLYKMEDSDLMILYFRVTGRQPGL
jgi:hypothetical protein